jgi:fumarate reductase flavoprotein subunit
MESEEAIKYLEADLVIIGGGGAGLTAALAASEAGTKSIIVLEKCGGLGGNTARATGLFACESPVQQRERIIADSDLLFEKLMQWTHWSRINPRILRAFLNKSGDTIRWLEEKGIEFDLRAFYPNQQPRVWHCPKGGGAQLVQVLVEKCKEKGVQLLLHTSGKKILRGKGGHVTGVIAVKDGEECEITTKRVIITTGGFGGNGELLNKYCPSYYDGMPLRGLPLNGDGLFIAADAGAVITDFATLLKEGPTLDLQTWPLMGLEREPSTIWVNKTGKRFINESTGYHPFESINAILRQPGKVCYTFLDSTIKQNFEEKGFKLGTNIRGNRAPEGEKSGLDKRLQDEIETGRVKMSDSWDSIADWIGAEHKVLRDTIDEYNSSCEQGYDELFNKERRCLFALRKAPFYAIKGLAVFLDTIGGIKINELMAVLGNDDKPIPGLYAAGVTTSGWEAETYCGELSGSAFGFAINSGRIAGENAVKENKST